jgi:hypothetical protein
VSGVEIVLFIILEVFCWLIFLVGTFKIKSPLSGLFAGILAVYTFLAFNDTHTLTHVYSLAESSAVVNVTDTYVGAGSTFSYQSFNILLALQILFFFSTTAILSLRRYS